MGRIEDAQEKLQEKINGICDETIALRLIAENDDGVTDDMAKKLGEIADKIDQFTSAAEAVLDQITTTDDASDADLTALHEAICEGRKQDAIDVLASMFPDGNFRSVTNHNFLFPNRVQQ